jgi:hypothetical protein
MRKRWVAMWAGVLALAAAGSASAQEPAVTNIVFESELWALNGDLVRQPFVPTVQKLDVPAITVTDTLIVTPSKDGVTQVANFKADFAGGATVTVTRTTMGGTVMTPGGATLNERMVLANPTDRFAPFTGRIVNEIHNQAGSAMLGGGKWVAKVPVDLTTRIVLDERDIGAEVFVANILVPGAVGDPDLDPVKIVGTPLQTGVPPQDGGHVAVLSIPITGNARPDIFTTGRKTVMAQIITARVGGTKLGTPTGFSTITKTSTGSATSMMLVFISPIKVDAFAGSGDDKIPVPVIGFARATNTGSTYVTPEPGVLLLGASVAALALLVRRRMRSA